MSEEILNEEIMEETVVERKNPLTVISKATFGEYSVHDIQQNSSWSKNLYGDDYAVVPDDLVESIMETRGFVDLVLNEEETEVVSFTALEIPEIPEPEPQPTLEQQFEDYKVEQTEINAELMYEMSLWQLGMM